MEDIIYFIGYRCCSCCCCSGCCVSVHTNALRSLINVLVYLSLDGTPKSAANTAAADTAAAARHKTQQDERYHRLFKVLVVVH